MTSVILIGVGIISLFFIWKCVKPYTIKYNTTLFITGELGSGKTLTAVKTAIICVRKKNLKILIYNKLIRKIKNLCFFIYNKTKKGKKKPRILLAPKLKAQLYSNIPIYYKPTPFKKQRVWSVKINKNHLILLERIRENIYQSTSDSKLSRFPHKIHSLESVGKQSLYYGII